MQMRDQYNMIEKSLFYWAGLYHNGLKKNQEYEENRKAITINILNFNLVKEGPCHEIVELKRKYRNIKLTDKLEMHFIQLEKFKQEGMKEENRELWNWLTFICNKNEEEVEKVMAENEEIKKANEQLEYLTGDEAVRRIAFLREKAERDYVTNMKGAKKEKKKIAKEMLTKGLDSELIKEITKLSEKEIEDLKKEI